MDNLKYYVLSMQKIKQKVVLKKPEGRKHV